MNIAMIYLFSVVVAAILFGIVKAIVDRLRKSDNSVAESLFYGFSSGVLIVGSVAVVVAIFHLIVWVVTTLNSI